MEPANEILPRLWLGNREAAANTEWLQQNNIKHVFNATKDIPFAPGVEHAYRIPVDDNLQEAEIINMRKWAPEAVLKLVRAYKTGDGILIHCYAGRQRSAALMAMFLIVNKGLGANEAMAYIRSKRPVAFFPAANFKDAIYGFEKSWLTALSAAHAAR
jgi:protein-tyrosine phosphatase